MTTSTLQLTETRVLLTGPLTSEAQIGAMLVAVARLESAGAIVLHPLAPEHPLNDPDLFRGVDYDAMADEVAESCVQAAELLVVLPGWETSPGALLDVMAAEAAGVGWVAMERLPLY